MALSIQMVYLLHYIVSFVCNGTVHTHGLFIALHSLVYV